MKYLYLERQKVCNSFANSWTRFLMLFLITCVYTTMVNAQILTDFPCYAVSEDNEAPNVLFRYDPEANNGDGQWLEVGVTGGTFIEAIATDPIKDLIYAVDGGTFGTIDPTTGVFSAIGPVGTAQVGGYGILPLDDVDGLSYDPVSDVIYASHRVDGVGPGSEDVLFKIDVATGMFIPGAMQDAAGNALDYAIVPSVPDMTFNDDVYDVDDIAYNPFTMQLLAIQNQDGPGILLTRRLYIWIMLQHILYPYA